MLEMRFRKLLDIFKSKMSHTGEWTRNSDVPWSLVALDLLPKPLFVLNFEEKRVSFINEAARKITGLSERAFDPREAHQRHYALLDVATGLEIPAESLPTSRVLRGEDVHGDEYLLKSSSGLFHIKIRSSLMPRTPDHAPAALIMIQDITELKAVEGRLRETQENLKAAVEAAQIGFWQLHVPTGQVTLSPILLEQFGIDPGEFDFTLDSTFEAIHPDDRDRVRFAIDESVRKRSSYQITYRVIHRAGEIRWIEATGAGIYGPSDAVLHFTGTTIDVTNAIKARELIQASKDAVEHERSNFRSLFRQTPEMVCILSGPDHLFVFVNEAHQRALGFDATGKTVREAQPESVEIFQILDDVYRTGVTAELFEIPVTLTDRVRYFNLTYAARRDLDGRIDGIMILGTEVSEQVLARESQNLQRAALELALNDAPLEQVLELLAKMVERQTGGTLIASILLADATGQRLLHGAAPSLPPEYNNAVHGIRIGENVGSCGTAAFTKSPVFVEDIETDVRWADYKEIALRQGLRSCWSTPILTARGKLLGTIALYSKTSRRPSPLDQQVMAIAGQTTALILGHRTEASERLASTKALRESESELKFTLDNARMGTWEVDLVRGGHVFLSPKAHEIFGATSTYNDTDAAISDFIHPDDRTQATGVLKRTLEAGGFYQDAYRIIHKNGEVRWVELRGRIQYNNSGEASKLTGLVMDITDRKRAEDQLQASKLEAERANAAKSQFLANMSHEIRTPLGAIMGFSSLMKDEAISKNERDGYLAVVERNSTQLLRIIDDILDLSKVEAGMMLVENLDFSLVEMLTDFSSLMGFKAREKGVGFSTKAITPLPVIVNSDPTRIRQILINVVGNAIKFTDQGQVELRICYRDGILEFEIEDSGRGISKDQEANLFQPFTQADASTTRKYGGTGLGLALSRRLAEALGGHFVLKASKIDVGSTFSVTVAASTNAGVEYVNALGYDTAPVRPAAQMGQLAGLHLLLVEDSPDNQHLISIFLTRAGATVDIASDGSQGFQMTMTGNYDVVLMDVQMPVMDGIATVRKIRSEAYTGPIIALTAHAMKEERVRCLEAGFSDFLSKPVARQDLLDIVSRHAKKREAGL